MMIKKIAVNSVIGLVSFLASLVLCELGLRFYLNKPIFELVDYRYSNAITQMLSTASLYDPDLGWVLRPYLKYNTFNTLEYGVRSNGLGEASVRRGGILVAGASFTAGSEVSDSEAWPAQLEGLLGVPVVNAAIGGYALDQIILRAEKMLPIVKPRLLVIDIAFDNVVASGFTSNGAAKPYFKVVNGKLVRYHSPVPTQPDVTGREIVKNMLGYSLIAHTVLSRLAPVFWRVGTTSANNDPIAVSCLLFERIKKTASDQGAALVVSWQWGSSYVPAMETEPKEVLNVQQCLQRLEIPYTDEFARLKGLLAPANDDFAKQYVRHPGNVLGHKSKKGNADVANDVADLIRRSTDILLSAPTSK